MKTAIENKIKTNQEAQTVQNELNITKAQAKKQIAKAQGDSISLMVSTNASALATRVSADADAYYNQKINQSLTSTLLEYRKIEAWDGKLPTYQGGGSPIISMPR